MTEIDNETIEKIANAVKNKHISDRWKDPKTAERWGGLGWWIALVFGVVMMMVLFGASTFSDIEKKWDEGYDIYQKISLANMDCTTLKKTLLELEASESAYVPSHAVEKQITSRCT